MHPRCGNHGALDPDSPCRPNLIARPRSTLLHIRLLPAFPRTIIWILRAPLEHRGFPLMIKRLCVTTAPASAIGSTRENCVHSVETDFALYSADTFDELSTIRSSVASDRFRNPRLNDGMSRRCSLNFANSPKSRCREAKSTAWALCVAPHRNNGR